MIANLVIVLIVWAMLSGLLAGLWVLAARRRRQVEEQLRQSARDAARLRDELAWSEDLRKAAREALDLQVAPPRPAAPLPHRPDSLEQLYRLPAVVPAHERREGPK